MDVALTVPVPQPAKRLNPFDRYLTLWVVGCMLMGVGFGRTFPGMVQYLRTLEMGEGSHINLPMAFLIWLMIVPMMMKVELASLRLVGQRPAGLVVTLCQDRSWLSIHHRCEMSPFHR
ncbi:MAG: hypothetical protein NTNFB02_22830 [Nitrospira sp.]